MAAVRNSLQHFRRIKTAFTLFPILLTVEDAGHCLEDKWESPLLFKHLPFVTRKKIWGRSHLHADYFLFHGKDLPVLCCWRDPLPPLALVDDQQQEVPEGSPQSCSSSLWGVEVENTPKQTSYPEVSRDWHQEPTLRVAPPACNAGAGFLSQPRAWGGSSPHIQRQR